MATKKPKTVAKPKSTQKPKTTAKTAKVAKPATEAVVEEVAKVEKTNTVEETKTTKCNNPFKGFFAKKYEKDEGILTIFKKPSLYGALIGEVLGTALVTIVLLSMSLMGGIYNISLYVSFGLLAIFVAIYAFSGAHLNPIVTAGMMATRRISVVRGVLYIIAQVLGAWVGFLIMNAFRLSGTAELDMPAMAEVAEGTFWMVSGVEIFGAFIIAFFYARAIKYKRSVFTFAATVFGAYLFAFIIGYVLSAGFLDLSSNYVFNPASALMFQILPATGESFWEIFGGICSALAIYAIFPMIAGVVAFYLSDVTSTLVGEKE